MVDLFSDPFCKPIEAQRVRDVAKEFGDKVILNEHFTDNRTIFEQYQISRAIFIKDKRLGGDISRRGTVFAKRFRKL